MAAPSTKFENMPLPELIQLRDALNGLIVQKQEDAKKEVLERFKAELAANGISVVADDLKGIVSLPSEPRTRSPRTPKPEGERARAIPVQKLYVNPDTGEEYRHSGRGPMKGWLAEKKAAGEDISKYEKPTGLGALLPNH